MIEFIAAAAARVPFRAHEMGADLPDRPTPQDYPYVVLWSDLGLEFSGDQPGWDDSLADLPDALEVNIRATYVGLSKESVAVLARRTRAALNRAVLEVEGWTCAPLRQAPLSGITADESVQIGQMHPHFAVDEYRLIATRELT